MRTTAMTLIALTLFVTALSACAGPTPAPAATGAPAPGGSGASTMPAQPTLPLVAPRQATPFASATPAPILNYPAPTRAGTAASALPTGAAAQTPASGPTAPGVATGQRVELKLEFAKQLVSAEEVDEIAPILKAIPGILSVTGNEVSITVLYDPGLILPNQIRAKLSSMGHAVKE